MLSSKSGPLLRRALLPMLAAAAAESCWTVPSFASSHREAPFIATQPQVDGTDSYMFRSLEPGRDGYVTQSRYLRAPLKGSPSDDEAIRSRKVSGGG